MKVKDAEENNHEKNEKTKMPIKTNQIYGNKIVTKTKDKWKYQWKIVNSENNHKNNGWEVRIAVKAKAKNNREKKHEEWKYK